jgi:hypothetical protein
MSMKLNCEALDAAVLHWLTRPNEFQANSMTKRPLIHCSTSELAPIVYGDRRGHSTFFHDSL